MCVPTNEYEPFGAKLSGGWALEPPPRISISVRGGGYAGSDIPWAYMSSSIVGKIVFGP